MLNSPLLVSSHSPRKVNNHHACTSSTPYSLQFAGKLKSIVKILCDLRIKFPCYVHVIKTPYFDQIVSLQTRTLQNWTRAATDGQVWKEKLNQDLTSGPSLRVKSKRSSIQAVGGGKNSRTIGKLKSVGCRRSACVVLVDCHYCKWARVNQKSWTQVLTPRPA